MSWDHQIWCRYLSWKTCLRVYVDHLDPLSRSQRSSLWINDSLQTWRYCDSLERWPRIDHNFLCNNLWWKTCLELYVGHLESRSGSRRLNLWIHYKHDASRKRGARITKFGLWILACWGLYIGHLDPISRSQMSTLWVSIIYLALLR